MSHLAWTQPKDPSVYKLMISWGSRSARGRRSNRPAGEHARRLAYTLVEMIISMSITSVLILGLTSSLIVSLKMLPNGQSASTQSLIAAQILDALCTEMENAVHISERTSTSFGFTVPDRDGDGIAERIRYAWSTTPGGTLTRQFNGGTPITLATGVQQFTLTPNLRSVSESYPGLGSEETSEVELINCNGVSGTGNNDVTATNWIGQYFKANLPAEASTWRPTRVRLMARTNNVPAVTLVQMRPAGANLVPTTTVLEEKTLTSDMLGTSYGWVDFTFNSLEPIAPDGAICLVLRQQSGTRSCTVQHNSSFAGLVKTSNTGSSWSHDTGKALTCILFGKRTLSDGSEQTTNTTYLMSAGLTLQMTANSPTLRITSSLLNHPELLSGLWELKFDQNPTTVNINGDSLSDWAIQGGGAFDLASLSGGIWRTSGVQLSTNPGSDFAKTTIVDLRMRNTSIGGNGATFTINALRSGSVCAPIQAHLRLQSDGTQTLTLCRQTSNAATEALVNIAGLPNQSVDLHLIIEPTASAVSISVNGVPRGTFRITRFSSADGNRVATIGASGSNAEFSYARIRVME